MLATVQIPFCYLPVGLSAPFVELYGFSDASENAYAGVVYLRITDSTNKVYTSLVTSKTRVSPIKRLSIPRLELCGAQVLTKLLCHVKDILSIPVSSIYAWTDSTIVLGWLTGNPRRFKTYVGNRVSFIIDQLPPDRWRHVPGLQNPADCASRGLFPIQLKSHNLWWNGPEWLKQDLSAWPEQPCLSVDRDLAEERTTCNVVTVDATQPILDVSHYSTFTRLKRVTAWILRFVGNLRVPVPERSKALSLSVSELSHAENYWLQVAQGECFQEEVRMVVFSSSAVDFYLSALFGTRIKVFCMLVGNK